MKTSKYLQIAHLFINDIDNERLTIGEKLPSLRTIMQLHDVSMTTAIACYRYIEQVGYAYAEDKKGYYATKPYKQNAAAMFPQFNSKISKAPNPEVTSSENQSIDSLKTAKLDTLLINNTFVKQSLHSAIKASALHLGYELPQGNLQLREQLAHHFSEQGFTSAAKELIVTHGCLDAVVNAIEIVSKPGDVLAVSSPCYSGLLEILNLLDRRIIEIPSTKNGMDLSQLTDIIENNKITACLLTANHQNPTGHSLNNEQKEKLAQLAAHYEIPIIEDDVFRELAHQKSIPLPIKCFDEKGWVIWCSSFSKSLAPGLRLGWCKPGKFLGQYLKRQKVKTLGVNQPLQLAMADYLSKGHYRRHLKKVNKALQVHCNTYVNFLQQHLPKDSQVYIPTGGLLLWIRVPNLRAKQLAENLVNHNILIQHGDVFSTTQLYQDCFRLNIGLVPNDSVLKQLDQLVKVINENCATL